MAQTCVVGATPILNHSSHVDARRNHRMNEMERGGLIAEASVGRFSVRSIACVAVVVLALPLVGCSMRTVKLPSGTFVEATLDLDPYQKRYYYYYYDPVTGRRKRVPSEWLEEPSAPPSQAALPGGHCPGAVPGADAQQADPDPGVVGALIKGCQWLVGGAGAP
jgi:hypothetical protein